MTFSQPASSCASAHAVMKREDGFAGRCCELVSSFLCCFDDRAGRECICRFYQHEEIIIIVEELLHGLARVAQVKLADENTLNAFLQW
jgi:hypothetical protein